jgi:hypothetical protein
MSESDICDEVDGWISDFVSLDGSIRKELAEILASFFYSKVTI